MTFKNINGILVVISDIVIVAIIWKVTCFRSAVYFKGRTIDKYLCRDKSVIE